jgi:hypothetical protein
MFCFGLGTATTREREAGHIGQYLFEWIEMDVTLGAYLTSQVFKLPVLHNSLGLQYLTVPLLHAG